MAGEQRLGPHLTSRPSEQDDPDSRRVAILAVDDDEMTLRFIKRCLSVTDYDVFVATDGAAALEIVRGGVIPAAVVADMQMPCMQGPQFLAGIRDLSPDSARILLTGHANLDGAIEAVNLGQICRFLTKPCTPTALVAAVGAGVSQYHLVTAEKELLERTLHGTIQMLFDVLSLTRTASFGRAMRIRRSVGELSAALGMKEGWELEVASMLSQFSFVTLPSELAERVLEGAPLSNDETDVVSRLPAITEQLLARLPRLETVRAILSEFARLQRLPAGFVARATSTEGDLTMTRAALLHLVADFDLYKTRGESAANALARMINSKERYRPDQMAALQSLVSAASRKTQVREILVKEIQKGMVLADDLMTAAGSLLVVRGYECTPAFVARCQSYPSGWLKEPIKVFVRSPHADGATMTPDSWV